MISGVLMRTYIARWRVEMIYVYVAVGSFLFVLAVEWIDSLTHTVEK